MKLNAAIIKEDLADICTDAIITSDVLDRRLRFPVLYDGETVPLRDRVYLMTANHLLPSMNMTNHPTFICIGVPDDGLLGDNCDLILIREDVTMESLLCRVSEIFDKYTTWENDMRDAVINNEPFETLGLLSDPIFENPVYLLDINLDYIFEIFNTKRYNLPAGYSTPEDYYYLSLEEINYSKLQPGYTEMAESKVPVIFENDFYPHPSLTYNIFFDGLYVGRLYVDEINRKISDRDRALITVLGDAVLSVMLNNGYSYIGRPKEMDDMLIKMLSHKLVAEGVIESVLGKLGWSVNDEYFCLTVEPTDIDLKGRTLAFLATRLSAAMSSQCYAQFDGKLVYILNLTVRNSSMNDMLTKTKTILRDSLMKAGISTTFFDFKNLYYYYRQTCIALQFGKQKEPTHWYHIFDDYILDHFLKSSTKGMIPDALCPEGLLLLRNYDAREGTDYMESLRTYLELGMNIAECSRKLFIHRNTFLYRLQRIREIMDLDLDDPDIRLMLANVLHILK